jgi:hypothetical protein
MGISTAWTGFLNKNKFSKLALYLFAGLAVIFLLIFFVTPFLLNIFFAKDIAEAGDSDLIFQADAVPAEENMYYDLANLADMIHVPEDGRLADFLMSDNWAEDEVADILDKNTAAFEVFDLAASKSGYGNPTFYSEEKASNAFSIKHWNDVSYLSGLKAIRLAKHGKAKEALDEAMKSIIVGGAIIEADTSLIEYLGALTFQASGLDAMRKALSLSGPSEGDLFVIQNQLAANKKISRAAFLKFEYTLDKNFIDAISFDNADELPADLPKYLDTYYFKKNQTKKARADFYRWQINDFLSDCNSMIFINPISEDPIDKIPLISSIKFKLTENAAGRIFNRASLADLAENSKKKRCEVEKKFVETESIFSEL